MKRRILAITVAWTVGIFGWMGCEEDTNCDTVAYAQTMNLEICGGETGALVPEGAYRLDSWAYKDGERMWAVGQELVVDDAGNLSMLNNSPMASDAVENAGNCISVAVDIGKNVQYDTWVHRLIIEGITVAEQTVNLVYNTAPEYPQGEACAGVYAPMVSESLLLIVAAP